MVVYWSLGAGWEPAPGRSAVEAAVQQPHHRRLVVPQAIEGAGSGSVELVPQRFGQRRLPVRLDVRLDDGRVDVAGAADGRRVAELLRHLLHHLGDVPLRLGLAGAGLDLAEGHGAEDGAGPGPKV